VEYGLIKSDPQKMDMLKKIPEPTNQHQLKAYLGLLQFYRDMLPHLAHSAHQLYAATSENHAFQWTDVLSKAFHLSKSMLEKEVLNTNLQGTEDINVYVDASKYAVCAVIIQKEKLVACTSKVLNPSQRRWATVERELYAVAWGLKKLRFYLHGVDFEIYTDHKPLIGLFRKETDAPNNRIATMLLSTSEYTFQMKYLPGTRNVIADFGTRHLDESEWDKVQEDDREGMQELFQCSMMKSPEEGEVEQLLDRNLMTKQDATEIKTSKLTVKEDGKLCSVTVRGQQRRWVPHGQRRQLFWQLHKDLHQGTAKMIQIFHNLKVFWPFMARDLEKFLSQCVCSTKKTKGPHKYSEKIHITAQHPLQILAIDLYSFGESIYFTAMCIFSRFAWVKQIKDKQATTVRDAYNEFCHMFSEPEMISCDNGGEFNLIQTAKTSHPSEHPASNGVIERFHQELGKLCRIFNLPPHIAYEKLNTTSAKLQFHSFLKTKYHDPINCVMEYQTRKLHYNDLVWRAVPKRKREKREDTFTGPHRVLKQLGRFSYETTQGTEAAREILL
jgi:hypothetical protein